MFGVFQNIDPPPPSPPGECVPRGGHTRWVERGMAGQYFGRSQTQLCTLRMYVLCGADTDQQSKVGDLRGQIAFTSK
jgi:hypothetical protein